MFSLNRAQIVGNLTRDPEMRYTPNGQSVCSFGVATNRRWKDANGNLQEAVEFHNIVAWGKLAEITSQILHKGNKIYVEGRLQTRTWEGQDGSKRNRTEIVAENFITLTPKGTTYEGGETSPEKAIEEFPAEKPASPKPKKKEKETSPEAKEEGSKEEKVEEKDEEINLDEIPF